MGECFGSPGYRSPGRQVRRGVGVILALLLAGGAGYRLWYLHGQSAETAAIEQGEVAMLTNANPGMPLDYLSSMREGAEQKEESPIAWSFEPGTRQFSSDTALIQHENGSLILAAEDSVYAIDASTGGKLWEYKALGGSLLGTGPTNVLVRQENTVYSVNVVTAAMEWHRTLPDWSNIFYQNEVALVTGGATLHALDAATGGDLWQLDDVPHSLEVFSDHGVVVLILDGWCRVIEVSSFRELLRVKINYGAFGRVFKNVFYLVEGNLLSAHDLETGSEKWTHSSVRKILSIHASESHLAYVDTQRATGVVHTQTGELLWDVDGPHSTVIVGSELIVLQSLPVANTGVYPLILQAFQSDTGRKLWSYATDCAEHYWSVSCVGDGSYLGIVSSPLSSYLSRTDQVFAAEPWNSQAGDEFHTLIVLEQATGKVLANITPEEPFTSFLVAEGFIYCVSATGLLAYPALCDGLARIETAAPSPVVGGVISITTEPEGARIYLDKAYKGECSHGAIQVEPGIHEVIAMLAGHRTTRERVLIEPGQSKTIHLQLQRELSVVWEASMEEIAPTMILVDQGVVIAAGSGGVAAVDPDSGRRLWSNPTGLCGPAAASHGTFTWAAGSRLGAVDMATGVHKWNHHFRGEVRLLAVGERGTFAIDSVGILHAINPHTGAIVWRRATKNVYIATYVQGEVLYLLESGGECLTVDAGTGETIWKAAHIGERLLLSKNEECVDTRVFSYSASEGNLWILNATTGKLMGVERAVSTPDILNDEYLVYHKGWKVGNEPFVMMRWRRLKPPFNAGGSMIVDDAMGHIMALSADSSTAYLANRDKLSAVSLSRKSARWSVDLHGVTSVHHLSDDMLLIPIDRTLYVIDAGTGLVVWQTSLASRIHGFTVGYIQAYFLSGGMMYKVAAK